MQLYGSWLSRYYVGDCLTSFFAKKKWIVKELTEDYVGPKVTDDCEDFDTDSFSGNNVRPPCSSQVNAIQNPSKDKSKITFYFGSGSQAKMGNHSFPSLLTEPTSKKSILEVSSSIFPLKCTTHLTKEQKVESEKPIPTTLLVDQNHPPPQSDMTNATLPLSLLPKVMTNFSDGDLPIPQGTSTTTTPSPTILPHIGSPPPKTPTSSPSQNNMFCMKNSMHMSDFLVDPNPTALPLATDHVSTPSMLCTFNATLDSTFDIGPTSKTEGTINRKRISIKDKARSVNGKNLKSDPTATETEAGSKEKVTETEYSYPNEPEADPIHRARLYQ
ncbi:hypothetical protein L6452_11327 [Arctium lappa]|uniref:Uncharacterized protein n=1 Tax=Arctium lappa TaxID=4217 RepID=A0ACB9DPF2_ARCLA|nr:hypothetical protein L6452_11327 [Arctium lappa]